MSPSLPSLLLSLTLLRSLLLILSMVPNMALPAICCAVIWSIILQGFLVIKKPPLI